METEIIIAIISAVSTGVLGWYFGGRQKLKEESRKDVRQEDFELALEFFNRITERSHREAKIAINRCVDSVRLCEFGKTHENKCPVTTLFKVVDLDDFNIHDTKEK